MVTLAKNLELVKAQAKDLGKQAPRSAYSTEVAGILLLARVIDKCRAQLVGLSPNKDLYEYGAPADRGFFKHFQLDLHAFEAYVATGADDTAIGEWVVAQGQQTDAESIAVYNNGWKSRLLSDLPAASQAYIAKNLQRLNQPEKTDRLRFLIDVLDAKDGRF
ncbi:MAG: DUF5069 domain-containing protein [Vampirovibrio sp.]